MGLVAIGWTVYIWPKMSLTKNFKAKEFFSRVYVGGPKQIPPPAKYAGNLQALAINLQKVRDKVGRLNINSGYRTPAYNKRVKGVENSQHLLAKAADVSSPNMTAEQLHGVFLDMINKGEIHNGGLGKYKTFVHYDIRDTPARWSKMNPYDGKKKVFPIFLLGILGALSYKLFKK